MDFFGHKGCQIWPVPTNRGVCHLTSISTVILSWENPGYTIECAESVLAAYNEAGLSESVIIIVDNHSSQSTTAALSTWYKSLNDSRVEIIFNETNAGFSGGMNVGIRRSRALGRYQYYWLLNNDISVAPGAITALLDDALKSPGVAIWGPSVISSTTRTVECAGGCRYFPTIGYSRPAYAGIDAAMLPRQPQPRIDYIYGAAMLLSAAFLDRIEQLDEGYFLFFEELELSQQMSKDETCDWSRGAIVQHVGGSSSVIPGVEREKAKQAAFSAFRYTWRYYPYFLPTVFLARFFGLLVRGITRANLQLPLAALDATKMFITEIRQEASTD